MQSKHTSVIEFHAMRLFLWYLGGITETMKQTVFDNLHNTGVGVWLDGTKCECVEH